MRLLAVGLLLLMSVMADGGCGRDAFEMCTKELQSEEGEEFGIVSEEQMKAVCESKGRAIRCANDFVQKCMRAGERDVYEATTGGKLKVVQQMCTDGTAINDGFLRNVACFQKLQDEVRFCNQKLKESQSLLDQAKMVERLKVFYGCCAFEWHRNCLAKAAKEKCDDAASEFVHRVSTLLGGELQGAVCSTAYSSCHGLHGEEETGSGADRTHSTIPLPTHYYRLLLFHFLLWIMKLCFWRGQSA